MQTFIIIEITFCHFAKNGAFLDGKKVKTIANTNYVSTWGEGIDQRMSDHSFKFSNLTVFPLYSTIGKIGAAFHGGI